MKFALLFCLVTLNLNAAFARSFNYAGELGCYINTGAYDHIEKFALSALKADGTRDLMFSRTGETFGSACVQQGKEILCKWKESFLNNYTVTVDMTQVKEETDYITGKFAFYSVKGSVDSTLARKHGLHCRQ